jgi:hypothetical protein
MVPYLQHHFIFINYAKLMHHVGSVKVTNLPSCELDDEKGIYRGRSFQIYGMVECFVKHSLPFYPGLAEKQ